MEEENLELERVVVVGDMGESGRTFAFKIAKIWKRNCL